MDARDIIFNYFDGSESALLSLLGYLDTDTLVAWFVDEGYADGIDEEEFLLEYYSNHCER